jgi:endonuclease/exonuclease/phosphatase (EEP) superfamily protein YafD
MRLERLGAGRFWPVWLVVGPFAALALVRSLGVDGATPIAFLLAFTPHAVVGALLVGAAVAVLRNWAAAAVSAAAGLVLLLAVLPRATGGAEEPRPGSEPLEVMSANVLVGRADAAALVESVRSRHPDVLAVQEITPGFQRRLRAAGIGRYLPDSIVAREWPDRGHDRAIYSRLPMRPISPGRGGRVLLTLADGTEVRVANVHPRTPSPDGTPRWAAELENLPSPGEGPPWLLIGDFNATLDHSVLRDILDRGYRDAADATGNGLIGTWPAGRALPPQVTIDHVLADRRFGISAYGVEDLAGSDHRAVHASVFLPPGGAAQ